jgi:hypothetical protein
MIDIDSLSTGELLKLQQTINEKFTQIREQETNKQAEIDNNFVNEFVTDAMVDEYIKLHETVKSLKGKKYLVNLPLTFTVECESGDNQLLGENIYLNGEVPIKGTGLPRHLVDNINDNIFDLIKDACFDLSVLNKELHKDYKVRSQIREYFVNFLTAYQQGRRNVNVTYDQVRNKLKEKVLEKITDLKKKKPVKKKTKK